MRNIIAFVKTITIVSSVLSCVWSLPTQSIEAALEIFSSTPEPTPTCFDPYPYPYNNEIRSIHQYAVDSEGRSCFESYKDFGMNRLFDKENFESNYANVTAENCPAWPQFKQCFLDHVNGDKCSEEERQHVVDSEFVNIHTVIGDLLCNPVTTQYFGNLWKNALNNDLWDCIFGGGLRELGDECDRKKFNATGHQARYQDIGQFFDCLKPGVSNCANGDHVKEEKMVELMEEFLRALLATHRAFWNY